MILIRPAASTDAAALAAVQVATWQSAYSGIMPQTYLEGLNIGRVSRRWRAMLALPRTTVWLAECLQERTAAGPGGRALSGDPVAPQVVGFAAAGPELENDPEYRACLQGLYVLPGLHGQGIGGTLLRTAVAGLISEGHSNLILWVLEANPVTRYYERLGGRPVQSRVARIGGAALPVTGYGWAELGVLKRRLLQTPHKLAAATIRPVHPSDALDMAQTQITAWRDAYQGSVPPEELCSLNPSLLAASWQRTWPPGPAWVLRGGGGAVEGFARAGRPQHPRRELAATVAGRSISQPKPVANFDGTLEPLCLPVAGQHQQWQAGRRLIGLAADRLLQDGCRTAVACAPPDERHRQFFSELGAQRVPTSRQAACRRALRQAAYGWQDLECLRNLALQT